MKARRQKLICATVNLCYTQRYSASHFWLKEKTQKKKHGRILWDAGELQERFFVGLGFTDVLYL